MKKKMVCVIALSVCLALVAPVQIAAQQGEGSVLLEEVVVTATRDTEEVRKVPASVSVISAEEIKKSGATSVVEVLDRLEGINFRTFSGNPSQSQIDIRGFGENGFGRTLILLDGKRVNRPDMASVSWLQLPISNIERIEVVRGSNSVLYGDSSIGGTINIITKKGTEKPEVNVGIITGSYGLHDERVGINGSCRKFSYAFNGENQKTFGYRERSKFSSRGAGLDLGYDASDYFNVSVGLSFNRTDFEMPGALTKAEMEADRRQYQPARGPFSPAHSDDEASNENYNADVSVEALLGDFGRVEITFLYGNKTVDTEYTSFSSFTVVDIGTFGVTPKYVYERDLFGHDNKVVLGIDYYYETLDKDTFSDREETQKTYIAELTRETLGLYIRDEFNILEDLIFSAGYRSERATIEGKETDLSTPAVVFDERKVHNGEAYEAGLTYLFGDKSKVFAKYARVYRYPFLDEQASYFSFASSDTFLTDLEKEKGDSYEIGTRFYPTDDLKIGLTVYRIDMEDEIVYVYNPVTFTGRNVNLDKTRHQGVEVSFSYAYKTWFSLYGNYSYQEAEFREGANKDNEIPLVPKETANVGLEIYLPSNFMLRPEVTYVGSAFLGSDNDNSSEPLDDYTLCNLFLFYRPEFDGRKLSVFFGVENITDEMYSTAGYEGYTDNVFYPSAGITLKGGISFEF
jgi:iron complex outermembrane receptor protein